MAFAKLTAHPLGENILTELVNAELARIVSLTCPRRVYLFGSAARSEMTDASDLDFLIVLPNDAIVREVKRRYYRADHPRTVPVDTIFVTEEQFEARSVVGGVCMVCRDEGRLLFEAKEEAS